ncbi:hypothetical protein T440DRAFT_512415 [Plenodomus tracheiphilus IPT5]|uniref:BZIP domain-containing protein n=1 Tax=Plenodomus tracheiphilus IPT5 TaxID=1408161 RepID=A0A6A7ALL8_9PLEO|nr:hypothetical protein T440DRAFT_512415 [Plenodomus tracheiphilus IPT5]
MGWNLISSEHCDTRVLEVMLMSGSKPQCRALNDCIPITAVEEQSGKISWGGDPPTISPKDTRFNVDYASPSFDSKCSFDNQVHNASTFNFTAFTHTSDPLSSSKGRCDRLQVDFAAHSLRTPLAQIGRRRGSECAEPGSARAVYLEKNRKDARKRRSKQKRQQEELVETARDAQRRNKVLNAEVQLLKSDTHDLMQIAGQHTRCPDIQLKLYLQCAADQLAIGGPRNTLPSPLLGNPHSDTGSIDKVSSPEKREGSY